MRACQPTVEGVVERDGVAVHYVRYGEGEPAILLLPTWSLLTSRHWKMQVVSEGAALADCSRGSLATLAGCGHFPHARDPVRVNLLIKQFADGVAR